LLALVSYNSRTDLPTRRDCYDIRILEVTSYTGRSIWVAALSARASRSSCYTFTECLDEALWQPRKTSHPFCNGLTQPNALHIYPPSSDITMLLRLPTSLHYPIRITEIHKRVGESIVLGDRLFSYTYRTKVTEGRRGEEEDQLVEREFPAHFSSTLEGKISAWLVWNGDKIDFPRDVVKVEEECTHEVQFNGLCTNCGKDLTQETSPTGGASSGTGNRAPIVFDHDTTGLTISQDAARAIDVESKRRLLAEKKLSLVVDLDQTIIHAAVDPTIGKWQRDTEDPNHEAVKNVRSFQLFDNARADWYYIKLRPGLEDFLETIAKMYEMHIYTAGTKQYAIQIAKIVDPTGKLFGDRILSRDESGSATSKHLERLFPIDTKMVVIIDDRGDVWKYSANLVRVTEFQFFPGQGDINASFLPKRVGAPVGDGLSLPLASIAEAADGGQEPNGVAEDGFSTVQNGTSPLGTLLTTSGSNDAALQEQASLQEKTIETQLVEKPLEKMQRQQDEKDAAAENVDVEALLAPSQSQDGEAAPPPGDREPAPKDSETPTTPKKQRHSILKDDDEELIHLEALLTRLHSAFYKEWDRKRHSKGGRVAALSGNRKPPANANNADEDNLALVPDIKRILPPMKLPVLRGVTIVFSGVVQLGHDIQTADISHWARSFGATIRDDISREVTHLVARKNGTAKVKKANRRGIKVVSERWLLESMQQWRKLDERPYLLEGASKPESMTASSPVAAPPSENGEAGHHGIPFANDFLLSDSENTDLSSGSEDNDVDHEGGLSRPRKRLKLETEDLGLDDEDPEEYTPPTLNQEEYDKIQEELREFMGSDMESGESDTESVKSELSVRSRKRRRVGEDEDSTTSNPATNGVGGSRLKVASTPNHPSPGVLNKNSATTTASAANPGTSSPASDDADRLENERIAEDQEAAEDRDRHEQEVESDSDDEEQRELEAMLEGGSDWGGSDGDDVEGLGGA
jgi:RNA polymerase II subunit A C-terminal domain phosphatase